MIKLVNVCEACEITPGTSQVLYTRHSSSFLSTEKILPFLEVGTVVIFIFTFTSLYPFIPQNYL